MHARVTNRIGAGIGYAAARFTAGLQVASVVPKSFHVRHTLGCHEVIAYKTHTCAVAPSPRDHGAHALVCQELHQQRVLLPPVDDVRRSDALRQAPRAALHPAESCSRCLLRGALACSTAKTGDIAWQTAGAHASHSTSHTSMSCSAHMHSTKHTKHTVVHTEHDWKKEEYTLCFTIQDTCKPQSPGAGTLTSGSCRRR